MTLSAGTKLGPYEILSPLGKGGMGEVYLANDTRLRRDVAVKVLHEATANDSNALARFQREAEAIAALSHPNILAIYDVGCEGDVSFLVTELLRGETVRSRIDQSPIPWCQALEVAVAIADGIAAAHASGIVHRDLKPQNIFLTQDGVVKILDFGLATVTQPAQPQDRTVTLCTKPGTVLGTPSYMSPEQVRGKKADARTDVFSFGCVLYEMLTGSRAFNGATSADITTAILTEDPTCVTESIAGLPPELGRVITRCLEKDARRRFQSFDDLVFTLRNMLAGSDAPRPVASSTDSATKVADAPSIAVLPFANMSADPENEYFSDGISEDIINALCRLDKLRVVARTSSFAFKGRSLDVRELGERLNADYVLDGSVRKAGNSLRITSQLVKTIDGYHVWSETFDRQIEDIFRIQSDIAKAITQTMRIVLGDREKAALSNVKTQDLRAYDFYLRGRQYLRQRRRKVLATAKEMFEEAIAIDPKYAQAYAGVADSCSYLYSTYDASEINLTEAETASRRAVELDPSLAEAHTSMGLVLSTRHEYAEAEVEFKTALELNPNLYDAASFRAQALLSNGKLGDAVRWFEYAQDIDPDGFEAPGFIGDAYRVLGRKTDAEQSHRRTVELLERHLELRPDDARALYFGAQSLFQLGERAQSAQWIEKALAIEPEECMIQYNAACYYSVAGDAAKALIHLEKAIELGYSRTDWAKNDPDFGFLHNDPRFRDLVDRMARQ